MSREPSSSSDPAARAAAAAGCAALILEAFNIYQEKFTEITSRARTRFEKCDWTGAQRDAIERLDLYTKIINQLIPKVKELVGSGHNDSRLWSQAKMNFTALVAARQDIELAKTFYNSTLRKVMVVIGTEPGAEYLDSELDTPPIQSEKPIYRSYPSNGPLPNLLIELLKRYEFNAPFEDIGGDAELCARRIEQQLQSRFGSAKFEQIDVIKPVFYRGNGAFIVGKIRAAKGELPLVLALRNPAGQILVDAVLLNDSEVSIVFSFTRSYFHVKVKKPRELVDFLQSIMPQKPKAELYISIGFNKHGKTELYRDLYRHLQESKDKFRISPGEKGMVMTVFELPSYDVVFKIIKDKFSYTKRTSRQQVLAKYHLVFQHDRAGRLVDAQEFEHLEFDKSRFTEELLQELTQQAAKSVSISGDTVIIRHLYTERRVVPLNIYLKEAPEELARDAAVDFGSAIKDMAKANIFPGDILLKNFGVTRNERVVFYDYDELCLLTDCNIREVPAARDESEELESEPWFYVGDADIFPQEFRTFIGLDPRMRKVFDPLHGDLFTVRYWQDLQKRLAAGEIAEILPYKEPSRLKRERP